MATKKTAIVIGAGVVGLASARTLSLQGYQVTIIERNEKAIGASIRNFGMLWPIGQPDGVMYQRALRSKIIWKEIADSIGLWYEECGSLHLAKSKEEWKVLQELEAAFQSANRPCSLMSPEEIKHNYPGIQTKEVMGGLFSPTETIVDPREAIAAAAAYLEEYLDVQFIWGKNVSEVSTGQLKSGNEIFSADLIVVCNGADFETLFPEIFASLPVTKCKLQMMRFMPGANEKRLGVSVCGGLSLIHYPSFKIAPSLPLLEEKFKQEMPEYLKWGIHVMVSQNDRGELTVGDSHEYGNTHDPFDRAIVNQLIMQYLSQFLPYDEWTLLQSWNGIYAKLQSNETEIFLNPLPGVYILNGVGGAGMTLSFGLAEEKLANI